MGKIKLTVWILILTLADCFFTRYIQIGGIIPDLLFTFVLCYSFFEKKVPSLMVIAALAGIITDSMSGRILGNYLCVYLLCSVLIYIVNDLMYINNYFFRLLLLFFSFIVGDTVFYILNISVLKDYGYWHSFVDIILPSAFYNLLISSVLLAFVKKNLSKKAGVFDE